MRIIAGLSKGRRLFAPSGMDTRPTTDKVKESLFSILAARLEDARVLDLFAGSGAMSLEALSRGAESAVLNDMSRQAIKCIERNVELTGFKDKCSVMCLDWRSALDRLRTRTFTLVFLDPPYRMRDYYAEATLKLDKLGLLDTDALIVMEHETKDVIAVPEGFRIVDERKYGDTSVTFVKRSEPE